MSVPGAAAGVLLHYLPHLVMGSVAWGVLAFCRTRLDLVATALRCYALAALLYYVAWTHHVVWIWPSRDIAVAGHATVLATSFAVRGLWPQLGDRRRK